VRPQGAFALFFRNFVAAVAAVRMTSALISDLLFGLRATDAANVVAAAAA